MPISIEDDKILINDVELDVVKTVGTIDAVISTTIETVEQEIQEEQVQLRESLTNTIYGVGYNVDFQLGYSDTSDQFNRQLTPLHLSWFHEGANNIKISQIACGNGHTMFLTDDGNVYGIGRNYSYQLGYSNSRADQLTPRYLSWFREGGNNITITQIACGYSHTMFLTDDGNVYGVGKNSDYQLGYSITTAEQSTPRHLSWFREGGNNITISQIACGYNYTMFLTDNGDVYGVGYNGYYQLGYSISNSAQSTLRHLSWFREGGNNITISQIACGPSSEHTMFLTNDGDVYGVGSNGSYQLGYNGTFRESTPRHLNWFNDNSIVISQIACGGNHTMFLTDDGNVYGVGYNSQYQLGYSNRSSQLTPRYLSWFREGGNNITISQIACGGNHTMFLTDDGNVYGVGYNAKYQLGYSNSGNQLTPRHLSWFREGGNNITIGQIACGVAYTMFLYPDFPVIHIVNETVTNTVTTTTINETIGNISYYPQWTYSSSNPHIYNYGNVGIGTIASDNDKLTINGNINIIGNIALNNLSMGYWYSNANNTNIYISGNLGIGSSDPRYSIESHGVVYSSAGGITGNASTYWITVSDRRIKSNIEIASNEICFENVKNIDLYKFNYIGKANKQYGFIAQEVAKYYPKAIKTESKKINEVVIGDLMSLDLSQINYTLFGAVKHVFNEINDIKKQIGMIKDDSLIDDEELLPE
jgi:alpha-tubulin suppressor-like RCC1 family protein